MSAVATARPAPPPPEAGLASGFRAPIARVRKSPLYHVGLLLVSLAMLLLPLAYVGLILLMLAGVVWYAFNGLALFQDGGVRINRGTIFLYITPLVVGFIGLMFMVKPLFAPRQERPEPFSLSPADEPVLFGFIGTLCSIMGAPTPRRIDVTCDVNASASFRRGVLSFFGNDLVLTIGLPLVAGMSLRQFTGVLAHEFGHFAQGAGMRTTYLVNRINGWFARVVYERDAWDDSLEDWGREAGVLGFLIILVARLFVWISRLVLLVLMWIAHAVSCFMMRQQEYDADRYEAKVAGSDQFAATFERLITMSMATSAAYGEIDSRWKAGQLPDDLVFLVKECERAIPPRALQEAIKEDLARRTRPFDTHPATKDRIRAVEKAAEPAAFLHDAPATVLFKDFSGVCRRASYLHYRSVLGERIFEATFVPTQGVVQERQKFESVKGAFERFYAGVLSPLRPLRLERVPDVPEDPKAVVAALKASRERLAALLPGVLAAATSFSEADDALMEVAAAAGVQEAGLRVIATRFHLKSGTPAAVHERRAQAEAQQKASEPTLARCEELTRRRLEAALSVLFVQGAEKKIAEAPARRKRAKELVRVAQAMARAMQTGNEIRVTLSAIMAVAKAPIAERERKLMQEGLDSLERRLRGQLHLIRSATLSLVYPFEIAKRTTLDDYLIPTAPPKRDLQAAFTAAEETLQRTMSTYFRTMAELAELAETAEAALNLEPLPANSAPLKSGA